MSEEKPLLEAEFNDRKVPVNLHDYVEDMEELLTRIEKLEKEIQKLRVHIDNLYNHSKDRRKRIEKIEQFLRAKFLEKWDSFEKQVEVKKE
jgi:predicted  nucleic acid-binding Zn-ribbon protein